MSFLISQMFANKRNAPTGSSFVFDILYSLKRNRNNVLWEFRNDKKLRKSLVDKFCQVDRLVNSDNSTESPILKAIGGGDHPNNKILISPHGATVQLGLNLWDNFDWVGLGRKNGNWRLKNGNWSLYLFCKYFFEHFVKYFF